MLWWCAPLISYIIWLGSTRVGESFFLKLRTLYGSYHLIYSIKSPYIVSLWADASATPPTILSFMFNVSSYIGQGAKLGDKSPLVGVSASSSLNKEYALLNGSVSVVNLRRSDLCYRVRHHACFKYTIHKLLRGLYSSQESILYVLSYLFPLWL